MLYIFTVIPLCSRSKFLSHSLTFFVIISGNIFLNNDSKSEDFTESPVLLNNCEGRLAYTVRNGICYVSLWNVKSPVADVGIGIYDKMPLPAICCGTFGEIGAVSGRVDAFVYIDANQPTLRMHTNTTEPIYASFSYPVKL